MLDRLEATMKLLAAMQSALPFTVLPTQEAIADLARQDTPLALDRTATVVGVSYLGDIGGIVCHIDLSESDGVVLLSLTHVRVPHTLPFAKAALAYQKHRVKRLKKKARTQY